MNRFHLMRTTAVLTLTAMACAPAVAAGRPRLIAIAPDSVRLVPGNVTEIDLRGSGFDTTGAAPGNTVWVGALELRAVLSHAGGTVLRIAIPSSVAGNGEAPPSRWMGGRYSVWVATKAGVSDTLTMAITSAAGLP